MNELDTFNKDKIKCTKCKNYYDETENKLCLDCNKKWMKYYNNHRESTDSRRCWEEWLNNEQ
jgi:hypothetical protein